MECFEREERREKSEEGFDFFLVLASEGANHAR